MALALAAIGACILLVARHPWSWNAAPHPPSTDVDALQHQALRKRDSVERWRRIIAELRFAQATSTQLVTASLHCGATQLDAIRRDGAEFAGDADCLERELGSDWTAHPRRQSSILPGSVQRLGAARRQEAPASMSPPLLSARPGTLPRRIQALDGDRAAQRLLIPRHVVDADLVGALAAAGSDHSVTVIASVEAQRRKRDFYAEVVVRGTATGSEAGLVAWMTSLEGSRGLPLMRSVRFARTEPGRVELSFELVAFEENE